MSFTKTLLAGAALCALATAPALAKKAPAIHFVGGAANAHTQIHQKTAAHKVPGGDYTITLTISASGSAAALLGNAVSIYEAAWIDTTNCTEPKNKAKYAKKTKVAKISLDVVTGTVSGCSNTFSFYGPLYTLTKKAKSDAFTGSDSAKKIYGYSVVTAKEDFQLTFY